MTEKSKRKIVKTYCPHCNGERSCNVHGHIYKQWEWSDSYGNSMNGGVDHSLLECRGCETIFYEASSWNSEDIDYWNDENGDTHSDAVRSKTTYPKPVSKTKPIWLNTIEEKDLQLHNILVEMYVAYDNQSYILTAIGLRTALDRGTEVLGIEPALTFTEKLEQLKTGGWIGDTEKEILNIVTDAGNAAAHRGWQPEASDVSQLLSALEIFLQRAFTIGKKALKIKSNIPPKPTRKKANSKELTKITPDKLVAE